jgi:hypothetical protein
MFTNQSDLDMAIAPPSTGVLPHLGSFMGIISRFRRKISMGIVCPVNAPEGSCVTNMAISRRETFC